MSSLFISKTLQNYNISRIYASPAYENMQAMQSYKRLSHEPFSPSIVASIALPLPYHYLLLHHSCISLFSPSKSPLPPLINGARTTKTSKLMVNYMVIICLSPITKDHALIKMKIYLHNPSKYANFASRMNDSPFL